MMSRKGAAYDGVFSYLKSAAPSRNLRRIHCDYERQQMKSFKTKYPLARVVGCLWHYGVVSMQVISSMFLCCLVGS